MKTVRELAEEIDARLMDLAREKGQRAACEEAMRIAEVAVLEAEERVLQARVALFTAYPELLGGESLESLTIRASEAPPSPGATRQLLGQTQSEYEVIEVDDPDVLPRGESRPDLETVDDLEDLWTVREA